MSYILFNNSKLIYSVNNKLLYNTENSDVDVEPITQISLKLSFTGVNTNLSDIAQAWYDNNNGNIYVNVQVTGIGVNGEEITTSTIITYNDPYQIFQYGIFNIEEPIELKEHLRGQSGDNVIIEVSIYGSGDLPGWRYLYSRQVLNENNDYGKDVQYLLYNTVEMKFQVEQIGIDRRWYGNDVPGNFMICVPIGSDIPILIDNFDDPNLIFYSQLCPIGYRVYRGPSLDDPKESVYGRRQINVNFVALSQIIYCWTVEVPDGLDKYGAVCTNTQDISQFKSNDEISNINNSRNYNGLSSTAFILNTINYTEHRELYGDRLPDIYWNLGDVDTIINQDYVPRMSDYINFDIKSINQNNVYVTHQIPTVAQVNLLRLPNGIDTFMSAWQMFMENWANCNIQSILSLIQSDNINKVDGSFNDPYKKYLTSSTNYNDVPYLFSINLSDNTLGFIQNTDYLLNATTLPCFELEQFSISN